MVDIAEVLIRGTLVSSFYALLAVGLTLVYSIAGIGNLAHGTYVMVGAYAAFLLMHNLGLPPVIGLVGAVLAGVVAAVLTWKGLVERRVDDPASVFMITLILALAVEQVFVHAFGLEPTIAVPIVPGRFTLYGTVVTMNLLFAAVVSLVVLLGLMLLVRRTYLGRSIVAVAQNRRAAELAGVDTARVYLVVWVLSGAFAGLVGVFYGYYTAVEPHMWVFPLLYSFSIVIVGGLGSMKGTVVAAYVIGFLELAVLQVNPRFQGTVALLALILIMLFKPQGLFGRPEVAG